jgi:eukaryotic-like serine/threonine-protein kinase
VAPLVADLSSIEETMSQPQPIDESDPTRTMPYLTPESPESVSERSTDPIRQHDTIDRGTNNDDFQVHSQITADYLNLETASLPPADDPTKTVDYLVKTGRRVHRSIPGYEILGKLGQGGMGVVYKARDEKLNRLVAIKMILGGTDANEAVLQRFQREAEAVAKLQHPNIVQIFGLGEADGCPYFALEFVPGTTLAEKVGKEPQVPTFAATMVETLARAMHVAHLAKIIHRDLKPANVLLTTDGLPKIADFGLAKELEADSGQTNTGAIVGTPSYMSPEQASGDANIGPAVDIYALGAILYDLLTGRPPFSGTSKWNTIEMVRKMEPIPPGTVTANVPKDLDTICLKCLQKEPSKRYATALELAEDVRRFLDGRPILARPVSSVEKVWRWARRNSA